MAKTPKTKTEQECYQEMIKVHKLLKSHASNMMLMNDGFVLMQPLIPGIRSYMYLHTHYEIDHLGMLFFSIPRITPVNAKFKKTKSDIDWMLEDRNLYLTIKNPDMELMKVPQMNREGARNLLQATYAKIPGWDTLDGYPPIVPDPKFIELGDDFIRKMANKEMCQINVKVDDQRDTPVIISRPFLGDLKKTRWLGYRVTGVTKNENGEDSIVLQFKQREELGDIYTYAAFLVI